MTQTKKKTKSCRSRGFTLIELLIVVAIIAILAAIAVPNFLEAQVRSKVSRVKNDLRALATAIESYAVDSNTYPAPLWSDSEWRYKVYDVLSSPIAYITSAPTDPFGEMKSRRAEDGYSFSFMRWYEYGAGKEGKGASEGWNTDPWNDTGYPNDCWLLDCNGPDEIEMPLATLDYPWVGMQPSASNYSEVMAMIYDASNGTMSYGQIQRTGGVSVNRVPLSAWSALVGK